MITQIRGKLVEKNPTYAVIDCAGVGYLLHISLQTFSALPDNENVQLFAHLSVREDAHTLYGFFSKLYAVYGLGTNDERRIASEVGIPPFLVKNYMAASRNYAYGKVEQILLLIQEYNLKVIGINNADNTDGDLLKELVIKIMDVPAK